MSAVDPLVIAPTGKRGLIEFSRTGCGHPYQMGECPECIEHASREDLDYALAVFGYRQKVRIGQTILDESDVRLLLHELDRHDARLRARDAA